jgi:hypothetical protein
VDGQNSAANPLSAVRSGAVPVSQFSVPGRSTRREFAVYVVVAKRREGTEYHIYVGKTGDNREGCNPVISRAGNHFSYNDMHSQIRNKLPCSPPEYDYEYLYVTFDLYSEDEHERLARVDVINEMERAVNVAIQKAFPEAPEGRLLNPLKGRGHVKVAERTRRAGLRTAGRMAKVAALVAAVDQHIRTLSAGS